jgi:LPPG:FO 2-phospho-L-lactate transferase
VDTHVLAIAGGVGGAKLASGLTRVLSPDQLTIVVNTGDDELFHGLHVSPDLDTVMYTLAGISNPETGWGLAGETFRTIGALERLGADSWFRLGDVDFATHIRRTHLLQNGRSLSDVTTELASALGIRHRIVPMTDDRLRTIVDTPEGPLAFQEYFVRRRCAPTLTGVRFDGADTAAPSPGFSAALDGATAIVYCPSNPLVSVGPVLAVKDVRDKISTFGGPRVAVSPIVGGQALKGPAAKMMAELGDEVSCVGVARRYAGLCDALVIDTVDTTHAPAIQALGMHAILTSTVMRSDQDKEALARQIVGAIESWDPAA